MNEGATTTTPAPLHDADAAEGETYLRGWRLIVARTVAFSIMAVTVTLGLAALVQWRRLAVPCEDALNSCLIAPEQVAPLARLGVTPTGLALGVVLLCCVAIALANGVAALLVWRRSNDAMALLVAVTLVLLPAFFTPMYQALSGVWRTAGGVISVLGGICFLLLLGLFPSGRFVPRWWSVVPLLAFGLIAFSSSSTLPVPIVLPTILLGVLSIVGSQIYRYRVVSTPLQRQQTKWAVTGIVLAILINQIFWQPVGWIPALQRKDTLYTLLMYLDYALLISVLAICFGVAIVRYRLYDIDIIIRRTLIYGSVTAILAGVYFAVVLGVQTIAQHLTGQTGQQPVVIVATTLLVAALFAPVRRRIQALIDRAFYRRKYDAALTLSAFSATLRAETDLGELRENLLDVIQQTMQPAHATLWLRTPSPHAADTSPGAHIP